MKLLRKVTHKIIGGRYYFHQFYKDNSSISAIVEDENGNIKLMNYKYLMFLPDNVSWEEFESKINKKRNTDLQILTIELNKISKRISKIPEFDDDPPFGL